MIQVKDILSHHLPLAGDVGLELEVEAMNRWPWDLRNDPADPGEARAVNIDADWQVKKEGSLRNFGIEFVSAKPLSILDLRKKIEVVTTHCNKPEQLVIKDCPRTSLHVHLNILRHTPVQLWNLAVLYWMFENVLIKYCGEDMREGLLFCLRLKDAEGTLNYVYSDLNNDTPFMSFNHDDIRYSSMNLNAIYKYGSIEFRGMRGTTDPDLIYDWSYVLWNLGEKAKLYSSPEEILDRYFTCKFEDFVKEIFPPSFVPTIMDTPDVFNLVEENVGMLTRLAYYHDWDGWAQKIYENTLKYKKKETQANAQRNNRVAVGAVERARNNVVPVNNIVVAQDDIEFWARDWRR